MIREFLMHGVDEPKWRTRVNLGDYHFSEKLDGVRAIWIPWTRGLKFQEVEFANRFKDHRELICTGLWSRKGKVIHAPDWFVSSLPTNRMLDGELFLGRGRFQDTVSVVRKLVPIEREWQEIKFCLFDIPTPMEFYSGGRIRIDKGLYIDMPGRPFSVVDYNFSSFDYVKGEIVRLVRESNLDHLSYVEQQTLPLKQVDSIDVLEKWLAGVFDQGGEGLMLRHRTQLWKPKRCNLLVKMVDVITSKGIVVGWQAGEGRLEGRMGSLRIKWGEKTFDLSGFTDTERLLENQWPLFFKSGQEVGFNYRELTDDGMPKQPRYKRNLDVSF